MTLTAAPLYLGIAQISVGFNIVFAKILLESMPASLYIFLRFLICTLLLALLFWLSKSRLYLPSLKEHRQAQSTFKDIRLLASLAFTGGFLFNFLMTISLRYTSAANAGVISASLPAVVVLFSMWLLKERLTKSMVYAVSLAIFGILVLNLEQTTTVESTRPYLGNFLVLLAMIPEALYTILNKISSKRFTALGTAVLTSLFATLFSIPSALSYTFQTPILWSTTSALVLLCSSIAALLFYWLWAKGLETIPASTASLFGGFMPLAAVLAGVLWLKEPFGLFQTAGMILVIGSIFLGAKKQVVPVVTA